MKNFRKILESINLNDKTNYDYQKKKLYNLLNNYFAYSCENIYNLDTAECVKYGPDSLIIYLIKIIKITNPNYNNEDKQNEDKQNEDKQDVLDLLYKKTEQNNKDDDTILMDFFSFFKKYLINKDYQNTYFYLKNPIFNDDEIQIKYNNNQGYITQIDLSNNNFIIDYQENNIRKIIEYDLENLCIKSDSIFKKYTNCNNELINKKQNISFSVKRPTGFSLYNEPVDVIQLGNTVKGNNLQLDTECKILITCLKIHEIKTKISEFMNTEGNYLKDTIDNLNIDITVKGKLFKNKGYMTSINILDKTFNVKYDTKLKEVLPNDRIKRVLESNKPKLLQQEIKSIPFTQLCIIDNACPNL